MSHSPHPDVPSPALILESPLQTLALPWQDLKLQLLPYTDAVEVRGQFQSHDPRSYMGRGQGRDVGPASLPAAPG